MEEFKVEPSKEVNKKETYAPVEDPHGGEVEYHYDGGHGFADGIRDDDYGFNCGYGMGWQPEDSVGTTTDKKPTSTPFKCPGTYSEEHEYGDDIPIVEPHMVSASVESPVEAVTRTSNIPTLAPFSESFHDKILMYKVPGLLGTATGLSTIPHHPALISLRGRLYRRVLGTPTHIQ